MLFGPLCFTLVCAQALFSTSRGHILDLTKQEISLVQSAWSNYRRKSTYLDDISAALKALVEQKPEVQRSVPEWAGVPMDKLEQHPGMRSVAASVVNVTDQLVRRLGSDERIERLVRTYSDWFHQQGVAIEELFLYPAGLVAERVDKKLAQRPDAALTKTVFSVAALLCSPLTKDFLGLSAQERRELLRAWTWFKSDPTFAMELLVSVFLTMPDTRKMAPSLDGIPTGDLMKSKKFRDVTVQLLNHLTTFVENMDKYDKSVQYIRDLSDRLHSANMPLLGTFLGGSILIIGSMKDRLGEQMDPRVERDMVKMTYASYPLLLALEKGAQ